MSDTPKTLKTTTPVWYYAAAMLTLGLTAGMIVWGLGALQLVQPIYAAITFLTGSLLSLYLGYTGYNLNQNTPKATTSKKESHDDSINKNQDIKVTSESGPNLTWKLPTQANPFESIKIPTIDHPSLLSQELALQQEKQRAEQRAEQLAQEAPQEKKLAQDTLESFQSRYRTSFDTALNAITSKLVVPPLYCSDEYIAKLDAFISARAPRKILSDQGLPLEPNQELIAIQTIASSDAPIFYQELVEQGRIQAREDLTAYYDGLNSQPAKPIDTLVDDFIENHPNLLFYSRAVMRHHLIKADTLAFIQSALPYSRFGDTQFPGESYFDPVVTRETREAAQRLFPDYSVLDSALSKKRKYRKFLNALFPETWPISNGVRFCEQLEGGREVQRVNETTLRDFFAPCIEDIELVNSELQLLRQSIRNRYSNLLYSEDFVEALQARILPEAQGGLTNAEIADNIQAYRDKLASDCADDRIIRDFSPSSDSSFIAASSDWREVKLNLEQLLFRAKVLNHIFGPDGLQTDWKVKAGTPTPEILGYMNTELNNHFSNDQPLLFRPEAFAEETFTNYVDTQDTNIRAQVSDLGLSSYIRRTFILDTITGPSYADKSIFASQRYKKFWIENTLDNSSNIYLYNILKHILDYHFNGLSWTNHINLNNPNATLVAQINALGQLLQYFNITENYDMKDLIGFRNNTPENEHFFKISCIIQILANPEIRFDRFNNQIGQQNTLSDHFKQNALPLNQWPLKEGGEHLAFFEVLKAQWDAKYSVKKPGKPIITYYSSSSSDDEGSGAAEHEKDPKPCHGAPKSKP